MPKPQFQEHMPAGRHLRHGWMTAADWLGAQRPLDLVCGAMALVVVLVAAAQALS